MWANFELFAIFKCRYCERTSGLSRMKVMECFVGKREIFYFDLSHSCPEKSLCINGIRASYHG